jgi:hypothetical protein
VLTIVSFVRYHTYSVLALNGDDLQKRSKPSKSCCTIFATSLFSRTARIVAVLLSQSMQHSRIRNLGKAPKCNVNLREMRCELSSSGPSLSVN